MALALLSAGFQTLPPLPTIKLGPSGADSQVGLCMSRHLWVSPTNSPVRLGVSPPATLTSTGVFNQRFEALFPHAGALGCAVCFAPLLFLPVYLFANVGLQGLPATSLWGVLAAAWPTPFHNPPPPGSASCHLAVSPFHPSCPSPPLLLVWMNVSSLTPW